MISEEVKCRYVQIRTANEGGLTNHTATLMANALRDTLAELLVAQWKARYGNLDPRYKWTMLDWKAEAHRQLMGES
jgi:hypothetical protein